jgi:type I restriction enzyme S subunit
LLSYVTSGSRGWAQYYTDDGAPFIRIGDLQRGTLRVAWQAAQRVSPPSTTEGSRTRVQPGDVLISITADLGVIGVVPDGLPEAFVNQHVALARPTSTVLPRYLGWFLDAESGGQRQFRELRRGATKAGLGLDDIRSIDVPLPSLEDQREIVAAIETHFSRLDAAVASLTRAKANVKRARASVLKAAVEGRLVPTEAALARAEGRDYEPAAVRVASTEQPPRPNRYKTRSTDVVPGHAALSVGDTQAALPEGWTRAPMVEVARMESGHTPSRSHPEWWDGDVPWVGIADARAHHGGVIHDTEQHTNADGLANSAARLLPAGTVCISRTASVGYVVVMGRPMATSQDFVDWICTDALDPHWVRVVFLADREALQRFGKGSVHKTIYFPELLSLHIAIPPSPNNTASSPRSTAASRSSTPSTPRSTPTSRAAPGCGRPSSSAPSRAASCLPSMCTTDRAPRPAPGHPAPRPPSGARHD